MDNNNKQKKQKEIELLSLMIEQKNNNTFIDAFIALYTNQELYGIMRKMQYEIRQRTIMELNI
jgi:hypothetical protein